MKLSVKWLKDYINFDLSIEELAHRLTMAGLEVEKISSVGGDTVFELEITPNRVDCLNVIGLAREVSAILDKNCNIPMIKELPVSTGKCDIEIKDRAGCKRYIATLIKGINISVAPTYITDRLTSLGNRAINNVVDITNFVLFETGQPLHAFDYDKLIGAKIIVRRARKGEKIITLDGEERELDEEILVIADAERPVAIAGIMGGKDTEVGPDTQNILLESAYFDPILIRRASRKLGLSTDSSYRFERGIDYFGVKQSTARAVNLILKHAGGRVAAITELLLGRRAYSGKKIKISQQIINDRLGVKIGLPKIKKIFKRQGFFVSELSSDAIYVVPPSFRSDIKETVDLVEEVARIVGYDNLAIDLPLIKGENIAPFKARTPREILKQSLFANGVSEVITYAMINREQLKKSILEDSKVVYIKNPLTTEQEIMRPSMLPSLLSITKLNINRGERNLRFFEIGKVYLPEGEKETLAILISGLRSNDWRDSVKPELNFYDLKGIIEAAVSRLYIDTLEFKRADIPCMEHGIAAEMFLSGQKIGYIGKINRNVVENWSIRAKNIFYTELNVEALYQKWQPHRKFVPPITFPSIIRDVSIAVKANICFKDIKEIAFSLGKGMLASVRFNEEYLGEKIPKGYRGISFSLIYQSSERTLTEEEVDLVHENIRKTLEKQLGAIIR